MSIITPELIESILNCFQMPQNSIHGPSHWARVLEVGRRMAVTNGANLAVVELFAVFHDSQRVSDGRDWNHGKRGADLAQQFRDHLFHLDDPEFELLVKACAQHTRGYTQADLTIQTCWDSDRLDLLRAGIHPIPSRLCTLAAQNTQLLDWANERARNHFVPENIFDEWKISIGNGD